MADLYIILGGWTRSESSYKKLILTAPKNTSVVFIPYKKLSAKHPAESLKLYIERLKIKRFNLIGHSLGGAIAISYTSLFPEAVSKLFLVDSAGIYGNENVFNLFTIFFKTRIKHGRKLFFKDLVSLYSIIVNPFLHFRLGKFAHNANFIQELKTIKTPTTIIWGEKDHMTPLWQAKEINKLIDKSKLVVIDGVGHDWILHLPEKFWENLHQED